MARTTVFPYTRDFDILVNHLDISEKDMIVLCSFKEDKDILDDIAQNQKIKCSVDVSCSMTDSTRLLLLDNDLGYSLDKYYRMIDHANKNNIEILLSRKLAEELNIRNSVPVTILKKDLNAGKEVAKIADRLYDLPIPVVAIMGMGENCSKFETELMLKDALTGKDYKTTYISSNALGSIFGMHTYPDYIFNDAYTIKEKIIKLNHDVYNLICSEKSDLLVISVPGGIMRRDTKKNDFPEEATIISEALPISWAILSLYYNDSLTDQHLYNLGQYCSIRYGSEPLAFCLSRQGLYYDHSEERYDFLQYDNGYYIRHFPEMKCSIINLVYYAKCEECFNILIKTIEDYVISI